MESPLDKLVKAKKVQTTSQQSPLDTLMQQRGVSSVNKPTPSLESFFPIKQQVARATEDMLYKPKDTIKTVTPKEEAARGVSISQGEPEKISPLRKIIQAVPGSKSFERNFFDPLAKAGKFLAPSYSDLLRQEIEADPKRSMQEIEAKVRKDLGSGMSIALSPEGTAAKDVVMFGADIPLIGRIKNIVGSKLGLIAKETNPSLIAKTLEEVSPIFKTKEAKELAEKLAKISDESQVKSTIDNFVQTKTAELPPLPKVKSDDVPTTQTTKPAPTNVVDEVPVSAKVAPANLPDPKQFKTADEFVEKTIFNATKLPEGYEKFYRGLKRVEDADRDIKNQKLTRFGIEDTDLYLSKSYDEALRYAKGNPDGVMEVILDKDQFKNIKYYGDYAFYIPENIAGDAFSPISITKPKDPITKSQLEDIWNQANAAPTPTQAATPTLPPLPKINPEAVQPAPKIVEEKFSQIEEAKKWNDAPAATQNVVNQEVAKTYSNTDAAKGYVTNAVNHIDNVPPIKNVTAKARNEAKKPNTPIDLPPETLRGWLQTRIQDSAYRLGLVQKNIAKSGKVISDDANAYMQREAYIGRAAEKIGRLEKKLGMVAGSKNGLFVQMKKDGIDISQLDEYMKAKAAKARNARVASKTSGKISDGGSGLTNAEADEILALYKDNTKIEQYAKTFRESAINSKMQVLKESGIYTDEQIKMITEGEPDYVPFKVEEFSRVQGGGKGMTVQSTGIKGLKGSARTDRTNAVIQSVVDYEEAVIRAEKNKALQSLAKLIRENPDDTLWEIKGVTYTPQYSKAGEVVFLRKNPINEKTSVEFFENGKAYEITFHDEVLAKVFTEEGVTKPIPGLIKINNYLRAVNTVISPEFMITNALRDLQTAIVTAGGEKGLFVAAKMLKDYPAASKGIWQAVRKESNTGWSKIYNEMIENGGRTGWFDLKDVKDTTIEVSKRVARYNSDKTSDALMRAVDATGKLISDANEVFEMSVRTAAYKQMVDSGMSKVAAANYAKNMTVNFNKKGNWGMTLNSAYLFANAGIQGSARLLMAMKNPRVRRITYGIAATSYAMNELNKKINPEGYERLQDFEKERNLIVMIPLDGNKYNIPGISGDPANGYYFKLPLPYGFNVFKVAGDVAYDVVNKKKEIGAGMVQILKAIDASFNPLSSGTATQFISPTVIDPFVSHFENKNWFGAPVMPEQPAFAPAVRDSDRYFSGARDLSVDTANFLNRITGGNEVTAGAVDISPETIDHVIDSFGGGLGNFIGQVIDGTVNTVKGDVPTPDEMPFVRKLIDTPFETGEQSQVFELLEKSATSRMSNIEINNFIKNTTKAIEMGQIDDKTAKRVIKDFVSNAARQEAGEVLSLVKEGKIEEAQKVIANAPPSISKELDKLIEDDVQKEIKRLKKELGQ